jgi:hypothetical protein
LAGILFFISHSHQDSGIAGYDTAQFYASHVWGLAMAEVIRAVFYAPILSNLLEK